MVNTEEGARATEGSLLQYIATTQAMFTGFTVILLDGGSYKADKGDRIFTDWLSIVNDDHRILIPLTAIRSIYIHNPGDK
jgi:hypothetical protein